MQNEQKIRNIITYVIIPIGMGLGVTLLVFSLTFAYVGTIKMWMFLLAIGVFLFVSAIVLAISYGIRN